MFKKIRYCLLLLICFKILVSCVVPIEENLISLKNTDKITLGMSFIGFNVKNNEPILSNKIKYKDGVVYQYMLFNRRKSNFQGTYSLVIALFKEDKLYVLNEYEHFLKSDDELLNYIGDTCIAEYLKVVK